MGKEQFEDLMEFFGGSIDIAEDTEGINFSEPVKGKYVCRIVELIRDIGTWPSGDRRDQWQLKLQACEDIEGDKSGNRFFQVNYDLTGGSEEYPSDPVMKRNNLFKALATADVKFTINKDESKDPDVILATIATQIVDQLVNISAYPYETKSGKQVQAKRVVNKFKVKAKKESKTDKPGW